MTRIARDGAGFVVPAPLLAGAFGLSEAEVRAAMRGGAMTSRCEEGVEEDAGKWRLTFLFRGRAFRLIVAESGEVLQRATFPIRTGRGGAGAGRRGGER
ncbi:MAG: hypothetical protein D6686_16990 [Alphaproteobacteria bacterium]|nr:MAG: hypothetical protein D6686_16990 [Alphaproteobacteria bacterium]